MADLLQLGDALARSITSADFVPKSIVGKSWFVFTQMLTEAQPSRQPEPIRDAA
jgi:hypothetical protein